MGEPRWRRRRDPAAELAHARHCIEEHERGIADLERAIADRRRTIEHWRAIVAKLEAAPPPGRGGAGPATNEGEG